MERISVAIRVKPTSRREARNGTHWKVAENTISLQSEFGVSISGQTYTFDKIFGTSIRNSEIYEHTRDLVLSAVSGFNGTVLAYGQTSSGKTYTMQGSASDPGVIRLAIQDVFINIDKIEDREFLVRVSYMEIYNEEINDLLAPENRKLQIYESIERGIIVAGLREEIADSVEQVIAVLERGEAHRQLAETDMNLNSSRSHTIFRMVIESRDKSHDYKQDSDPSAHDAVRVSTLNLVDLAGSERISKSGAEAARSKEGAHINKSLTTLGMVINKLSKGGGKQGSHIPYRDSKLTRLLQSALGGNARTAIICTINPDEIHIDETRSTLKFASRAKRVTNCAQVNEILTEAALLKRQKEEIKELRRRLEGSPHTEDLKKEILHLRNNLLKYELGRERLELELQQEIKSQVERERWIKEQEQRIESEAEAIEDRELPKNKGLRRVNSGKDHFCVSASRLRNSRPSLACGNLDDDEMGSFWSSSSEANSLPAFGDYQNVADGDMWTYASEFESNRESKQGQLALLFKSSSETSMLQRKTKEAIATANTALLEEKLRFQNQEIKKLLGNMKDMEVELKNCQQENSQLRAKTLNLDELLHTRAVLEEGVQERIRMDEKNELYKQNLCSLEMRIQDDHYRRFNGTPCLKDDFTHDELEGSEIRDMCSSCRSSMNENIRRSSMQCGVLNTDCTSRKSVNEAQDTQISEILMHEAGEGQFFDDKYSMDFQMHYQESSQNWNGSKSRLASQEAKNLKSSLHLANRLGNKLLQVLHSIENHDIRCLEGHAASKGTVGKSLEALQVLLLESAHVGLRLFSNLSSKESSLAPTKLQQLIHEVANVGASSFRKDCSATEKGGHETSLIDPLKVETETGKENVPHPLPKHNKFIKSAVVRNKRPFLNKKFGNHKGSCETEVERLNFCRQYSATLNTELAPEDIEQERHPSYFKEQLSLSNEVLKLTKATELLLVRDMETSLGALALQNGVITTICAQIKEFETNAVKLYQRSEIDPDETQLVLEESVCSIRSTHDAAIRQGMHGWSIDSMPVRNSVEQSDTWYQSLDDASLLSSQDPGEDICNIDLHQACDEEPGMVLSGDSVILDMHMTDKQRSIETNQEYLLKVQADGHFAEELKIMRNMSEAEKQFMKELLNKVKALEAGLTVAEMEIVEYKVEIEHLKMNNLRTSLDTSLHCDDWELQNLRAECEIQKEEIRQLMEQVMTPDHELERESLLQETMERNSFLENCLKEAEGRLLKAKGWLEELLQLRDAESRRELLSSDGTRNRASSPTSFRRLGTVQAPNQDETEHPGGPNCRPLRQALREVQLNLSQPYTTNDLGGYTDIKKLHLSDLSEKENRPCPLTASH